MNDSHPKDESEQLLQDLIMEMSEYKIQVCHMDGDGQQVDLLVLSVVGKGGRLVAGMRWVGMWSVDGR